MKTQKFRITAFCVIMILVIFSDSMIAQVPKPLADAKENDNLIREMLSKEKLDDAIIFVDECLKLGSDKEFYLECKLQLLSYTQRIDERIECALMLDKIAGTKRVATALHLADLYLDNGNKDEALVWLQKAADRGIKDFRLIGDEKWEILKEDAEYKNIRKRMLDNQGINKPIKDFTVKLVNGDDFKISQLKGKVVLIDFWATWCAPCVATIPDLKKYYDKYNQGGFEVVGISLDRDINPLKSYINKNNIQWYISFSGKAWGKDDTANLYGVNMIPTTFLVDKAGRLRYYNIHSNELENAIRSLLNE